jgi:hypothetical protein
MTHEERAKLWIAYNDGDPRGLAAEFKAVEEASRWKRYCKAVLDAVLDNEGTAFDHDWEVTDEEKTEIKSLRPDLRW